MKKILLAAIALTLSACSDLDVVKTDAVRSFGDILKILPAENSKGDSSEWVMTAPDNTAWFRWKNQEIKIIVDARPFISAGLDLSKLENGVVNENTLVYSSPLSNAPELDTPLKLFEKNADFFRASLGYHPEMDHYNFTLENGNIFEWAKDLNTNGTTGKNQDLDIVFALNPEPLITAGVDTEKLEGWTYTQVPVDIDGKPTKVWKILKAFNLK
ncbi:MAG: hypothetical protein LBC87_12500 [Fibromonadaceae bacterium]|jgi:hypothetical protein|nr:hypothetical protein [Fibromonadaceae bacterium]